MKIGNFVEDVVHKYSDKDFKKHFRINRGIVYELIDQLEGSNFLPKYNFGREKISSEKACLLMLWYLANQETFRQISDRFNVTTSSAHRCLKKICLFFLNMKDNFIFWPNEN